METQPTTGTTKALHATMKQVPAGVHSVLNSGEEYALGTTLTCSETTAKAVLQPDGDFVLRNPNGSVAWRSGTAGRDVRSLAVFPSGDVVLLDSERRAVWRTNTDGQGKAPYDIISTADGLSTMFLSGSDLSIVWDSTAASQTTASTETPITAAPSGTSPSDSSSIMAAIHSQAVRSSAVATAPSPAAPKSSAELIAAIAAQASPSLAASAGSKLQFSKAGAPSTTAATPTHSTAPTTAPPPASSSSASSAATSTANTTRLVCHHKAFADTCGTCTPDGVHCLAIGVDQQVSCHHAQFVGPCCANCKSYDNNYVKAVKATPRVLCHHRNFLSTCGSCTPDGVHCVQLNVDQELVCHHNLFKSFCAKDCKTVDGANVKVVLKPWAQPRLLLADPAPNALAPLAPLAPLSRSVVAKVPTPPPPSVAAPGTRIVCHHRAFADTCGTCHVDGEHCVAIALDEEVVCHHSQFKSACCSNCKNYDGVHVKTVKATPRVLCHHRNFLSTCGSCTPDGVHCVQLNVDQELVCHHNLFKSFCAKNCKTVDGANVKVVLKPWASATSRAATSTSSAEPTATSTSRAQQTATTQSASSTTLHTATPAAFPTPSPPATTSVATTKSSTATAGSQTRAATTTTTPTTTTGTTPTTTATVAATPATRVSTSSSSATTHQTTATSKTVGSLSAAFTSTTSSSSAASTAAGPAATTKASTITSPMAPLAPLAPLAPPQLPAIPPAPAVPMVSVSASATKSASSSKPVDTKPADAKAVATKSSTSATAAAATATTQAATTHTSSAKADPFGVPFAEVPFPKPATPFSQILASAARPPVSQLVDPAPAHNALHPRPEQGQGRASEKPVVGTSAAYKRRASADARSCCGTEFSDASCDAADISLEEGVLDSLSGENARPPSKRTIMRALYDGSTKGGDFAQHLNNQVFDLMGHFLPTNQLLSDPALSPSKQSPSKQRLEATRQSEAGMASAATATAAVDAREYEDLTKKLGVLTQEHATLAEEREKLKAAIDQRTAENELLQKKIDDIRTEGSHEQEALRTQLKESRLAAVDLEVNLRTLNGRVKLAEQERDNATKALATLDELRATLAAQQNLTKEKEDALRATEAKLSQKSAEGAKLEGEVTALRQSQVEKQAAVDRMQQQNAQTLAAKSAVEATLEAERRIQADKEARISQLQKDLKSEQEKYEKVCCKSCLLL